MLLHFHLEQNSGTVNFKPDWPVSCCLIQYLHLLFVRLVLHVCFFVLFCVCLGCVLFVFWKGEEEGQKAGNTKGRVYHNTVFDFYGEEKENQTLTKYPTEINFKSCSRDEDSSQSSN